MQKFLCRAIVRYVASAFTRNAQLFSASVVLFKKRYVGTVLRRADSGKKSCRAAAYDNYFVSIHRHLLAVGVVDVVFVPDLFKLMKSYAELVLLFAGYRNYERVDNAQRRYE